MTALAQLRHAYAQLYAGTVKDQRAFAIGLLGPAIAELERAQLEPVQIFFDQNGVVYYLPDQGPPREAGVPVKEIE